jgi:arylsulfatase A-like enzyme
MRAVVLTLRGLHLGYIGCYGNAWVDTPALDQLAAEGVVFDQHFADCPDGTAAVRAWRSGQYHLSGASASPGAEDLLAVLHRGEVFSWLIHDACLPLPADFSGGWDRIDDVATSGDAESLLEAVQVALDRLAGQRQWLLWLDVGTLLPPWTVPSENLEPYFQPHVAEEDEDASPGEAEAFEPLLDPAFGPLETPQDATFLRLQSTYAGAVSYADSIVGALLEELQVRELYEEVALLITADHGQALGEHGVVGPCRPWLHDELIHIPLLIRLPGGAQGGRRVFGLTQAVDLYSTLLDTFGMAIPPNHGYSLLPMALGDVEAVRSHLCCGWRLGEREEWALRTPEWSFLLPVAAPPDDPSRTPQLYVKPDDRWEVNNVLQHHLELAERFEQTLRAFMAAPRRIGLETPWTAEPGGTSP